MKVIFIFKNQSEREVNFKEGQTLLEIAEQSDIPIHGNCEGNRICGGCHVLIENFHDKLPKISEQENDALDNAICVTSRSRLACCLVLNQQLDGLRVKIPT
ncbi:MAG: 2Fe-2S iron-sulfur cluster binding domain-containing protein [Holosporaceae bacterium]|jgi:2Fe-2S ferredoxin|nr:2Fe-2S iron-sulfur cluster binding domain-containing protein [Holosporaceae bacterium]